MDKAVAHLPASVCTVLSHPHTANVWSRTRLRQQQPERFRQRILRVCFNPRLSVNDLTISNDISRGFKQLFFLSMRLPPYQVSASIEITTELLNESLTTATSELESDATSHLNPLRRLFRSLRQRHSSSESLHKSRD